VAKIDTLIKKLHANSFHDEENRDFSFLVSLQRSDKVTSMEALGGERRNTKKNMLFITEFHLHHFLKVMIGVSSSSVCTKKYYNKCKERESQHKPGFDRKPCASAIKTEQTHSKMEIFKSTRNPIPSVSSRLARRRSGSFPWLLHRQPTSTHL